MKAFAKKSRGFGLLETLVACAILIVVCGALLAINVIIVRDIAFVRGRSVAFGLAQEAIESVRQNRDSNLIDGNQATNWNTFVCNQSTTPNLSPPNINGTNYYKITALSASSTSNCYGTTPRITLVSDTTRAGEDIVIGPVKYTRKIYFVQSGVNPDINDSPGVTEANAIRMVVEISWTESGSSHKIEMRELLTNWKRGF